MRDKSVQILDRLNEISSEDFFGGYIANEVAADIIREVMYGIPRSWGSRQIPFTDEQEKVIYKIFRRMEAKKVVRFSKAGGMLKPLITSAEWLSRQSKNQ